MTFKISDKDQFITIYNLRADTGEYIGKGDAYIPAHTGLPAYCTDITPPEISGNRVAVFDGKVWSVIEDHRGKTVYNILTGNGLYIEHLGPLPENTISVASPGEFFKWNGVEWIPDPEAQKAFAVKDAEKQKNDRLSEATMKINILQDAVELNIATDEEVENLKQWKQYRVLLNRIDINVAPDIAWPTVHN